MKQPAKVPAMKVFVHSLTSFAVIITAIHCSWYLFQENYVPKEQRREIPIFVMYRHLINKYNRNKPDDTN